MLYTNPIQGESRCEFKTRLRPVLSSALTLWITDRQHNDSSEESSTKKRIRCNAMN